jgi:transcriptional regulator with XRE-family HTH domain
MSTKKKSDATQFLEKLTGGPLTMGELLRALRKSEGRTQEEFASYLEITKQHICDIEKGRKLVSPSRAALFAKRLGQPAAFFIQVALQEELRNAGLKIKVRVEPA